MLDEVLLRRPGFFPGRAICLADGQFWTFSGPPHAPPRSVPSGPRLASNPDESYFSLLEALPEAENLAERRRVELALAIHLLTRNYDLSPRDLTALLDAPDEPHFGSRLQQAFSELASVHLGIHRHRLATVPEPISEPAERLGARLADRVRGWLGLRLPTPSCVLAEIPAASPSRRTVVD